MFIGHAALAFALVGGVAIARGWTTERTLAIAVVAGAFAALPDVDMVYALVGVASIGAGGDALALAGAFWSTGNVVHRAITHSLVLAPPVAALAALRLRNGTVGIRAVSALVATVLVVNLRMVMYSASIAPHFREIAARWKALMAYLLTDQAYALSVTRFRETDVSRRGYYLGVAAPLWVVWQLCTLVGIVVGARVPAWLPLDFALPLVFLALLVPAIEDAGTAAAGLVGGTLATLGSGLPYELGLPLGAVCGVLAGLVAEPVGRVLREVVGR